MFFNWGYFREIKMQECGHQHEHRPDGCVNIQQLYGSQYNVSKCRLPHRNKKTVVAYSYTQKKRSIGLSLTRSRSVIIRQTLFCPYDFRKARSTIDALWVVVETPRTVIDSKRWKSGSKMHCAFVTIDVGTRSTQRTGAAIQRCCFSQRFQSTSQP